MLRSIIRVDGGSITASTRMLLCLCDPCCGHPGDRWLARLSHAPAAA